MLCEIMVSAGVSVGVKANGRKRLKKKLTEISFRSAQSEFEATFTFTDTAKVKL